MTYYLTGIALMSLITFIAYGVDKYQSMKQKHRIKEHTLLILALLLGSPGAIMGAIVFNHKTQKLSFTIINTLCLSAHLFIGVWLYINQ